MAKGNLFQGMARGKVGDVVFSRLNGQQISRVRNRSPRNPNTNKQLVQRAVMANIMAMYSAGQTIFNHAFQGKAVGAENQREFMKSNVNLLRSLVVSEMNAGTAAADCKGHVGVRGMNIASPFEGAIISKGTYDQSVFTFDNGGFKLPVVNANETIGAYAARIGLIPGDLYTFVAYGLGFDDVMANLNVEQESASGNTDRLYNCRFEYVQFKVKENILANTTAITAATVITDLFDDYQHSGEPFADEFLLTGTIGVQDILSYADAGCIGCIRSREYEDLRSNSFLHVSTGKWGFATPYLLSVWDETTTLQGTTLILEGSNFSRAGGSASPTPVANSLGAVSGLGSDYYLACELSNGELALVSVNGEIPTGALDGTMIEIEYTGQKGESAQQPENVDNLVSFDNTTGISTAKNASGLSNVVNANLVPDQWDWDAETTEAEWTAFVQADDIVLRNDTFAYDDTSIAVEDLNG